MPRDDDRDDRDDDRPSRRAVSRRGFQCPFCSTDARPIARSQISQGGWIVFALMIVFCFPLFWIGLLMKDEYRVCSECGMKLG